MESRCAVRPIREQLPGLWLFLYAFAVAYVMLHAYVHCFLSGSVWLFMIKAATQHRNLDEGHTGALDVDQQHAYNADQHQQGGAQGLP